MRWNVRDIQTGETITLENPTDSKGQSALRIAIAARTTVGRRWTKKDK